MTARKPLVLKLLANTSRPDRVPPATPGLPQIGQAKPPHWMRDVAAIEEFKRLAPLLASNRLLSEGNISLLAHLCMLHSRLSQSWGSGSTPTAALVSVYRRLSNDLGLTHLVLPVPTGTPNRFSTNGKRR